MMTGSVLTSSQSANPSIGSSSALAPDASTGDMPTRIGFRDIRENSEIKANLEEARRQVPAKKRRRHQGHLPDSYSYRSASFRSLSVQPTPVAPPPQDYEGFLAQSWCDSDHLPDTGKPLQGSIQDMISLEGITDPVLLTSGVLYESRPWQRWKEASAHGACPRCPATGQQATELNLPQLTRLFRQLTREGASRAVVLSVATEAEKNNFESLKNTLLNSSQEMRLVATNPQGGGPSEFSVVDQSQPRRGALVEIFPNEVNELLVKALMAAEIRVNPALESMPLTQIQTWVQYFQGGLLDEIQKSDHAQALVDKITQALAHVILYPGPAVVSPISTDQGFEQMERVLDGVLENFNSLRAQQQDGENQLNELAAKLRRDFFEQRAGSASASYVSGSAEFASAFRATREKLSTSIPVQQLIEMVRSVFPHLPELAQASFQEVSVTWDDAHRFVNAQGEGASLGRDIVDVIMGVMVGGRAQALPAVVAASNFKDAVIGQKIGATRVMGLPKSKGDLPTEVGLLSLLDELGVAYDENVKNENMPARARAFLVPLGNPKALDSAQGLDFRLSFNPYSNPQQPRLFIISCRAGSFLYLSNGESIEVNPYFMAADGRVEIVPWAFMTQTLFKSSYVNASQEDVEAAKQFKVISMRLEKAVPSAASLKTTRTPLKLPQDDESAFVKFRDADREYQALSEKVKGWTDQMKPPMRALRAAKVMLTNEIGLPHALVEKQLDGIIDSGVELSALRAELERAAREGNPLPPSIKTFLDALEREKKDGGYSDESSDSSDSEARTRGLRSLGFSSGLYSPPIWRSAGGDQPRRYRSLGGMRSAQPEASGSQSASSPNLMSDSARLAEKMTSLGIKYAGLTLHGATFAPAIKTHPRQVTRDQDECHTLRSHGLTDYRLVPGSITSTLIDVYSVTKEAELGGELGSGELNSGQMHVAKGAAEMIKNLLASFVAESETGGPMGIHAFSNP